MFMWCSTVSVDSETLSHSLNSFNKRCIIKFYNFWNFNYNAVVVVVVAAEFSTAITSYVELFAFKHVLILVIVVSFIFFIFTL